MLNSGSSRCCVEPRAEECDARWVPFHNRGPGCEQRGRIKCIANPCHLGHHWSAPIPQATLMAASFTRFTFRISTWPTNVEGNLLDTMSLMLFVHSVCKSLSYRLYSFLTSSPSAFFSPSPSGPFCSSSNTLRRLSIVSHKLLLAPSKAVVRPIPALCSICTS